MMAEKRANVVSQTDWQALERINDLLAGSSDLPSALQMALGVMLETLGRPGGALYVKMRLDGENGFWVQSNAPLHYSNQIEDPHSQLWAYAQRLVDRPSAGPGAPQFGLAGAFPVAFGDDTVAALLVWGEPIPAEAQPRWGVFIRPLARALHVRRLRQEAPELNRELLAMQMFVNAYNGEYDINLIQRLFLQSMQVVFEAEDALLILLDEENPRAAIKKRLGYGGDWVERASVDVDAGTMLQALKEGKNLDEEARANPQIMAWLKAAVAMDIQDAIFSAVTAGGTPVGAAILLNPLLERDDPFRKSLLRLMSTLLANALLSHRKQLSLKIAVADLEANRWEIINSRNTLRAFFDSIPASVYVIDQAYMLEAANWQRSQRAGKHPSEIVGRRCYEQLFGRSDPCPACRVMETFGNGASVTRHSREWIDQERFLEWEITSFSIQEPQHPPHQVIVFEEDVTEKRNLEANLIQSEKLAAVGQLAAGVAHEINNPLSAIIANAQLLLRELPGDDQDTVEALQLIETAGRRASQVVSNLLGIARKEKKYEFELVDLNDTITGALSLVHHEIVQRSIEVRLDLQRDMPQLMASKNHLQGVWINMIVNGIDAIARADGQLSITTRYKDGAYRVILADNGRGIPPEQLSHVFEPFFTTKPPGKGTGLGLSVCLRVIKEHQGNITVDSQPERGTVFTVTLPRLPGRA